MANMKIVYNDGAGTFTFDENPYPYIHVQKDIFNSYRSAEQSLIGYHLGKYNIFELNFNYMGTNQYQQFKTIKNTAKSFDFYPMDEVVGTSTKYTVEWTNDFDFTLVDSFWTSGYYGKMTFEEV